MNFSIGLMILSLIYLLLIAIIYFTKEKKITLEIKIYQIILFSTIIGLIVDLLGVYANYNLGENNFFRLVIVKMFMAYIITFIYLITLYLMNINKNKLNQNIKFKEIKNIKLILIIYIFSIIINFILPVEYYSENGVIYIYGLCTSFAYLSYGINILYWITSVIKNKNLLKTKKIIPIMSFVILTIPVVLIQLNNPEFLLITSLTTFITIFMYHTIENPDVKMVEQLNVAKDSAEKANLAKSDFLSSMSHEIRTPLNAIVGLSQDMMDNEKLPDNFKEDAADIVNASNTLLEIVGNIIDISKIESDKMEKVEMKYSIIELVESVVKLNEIRIGDKDLKLKVSFAKDLPYELYGDKFHLKQIVNNLVSNALKYTEKGYVKIHVKCINKEKRSLLIISVEDTGRGIKKESVNRLFDKFDRLDAEKNSTIEGVGLGLAITKKLVTLLGGKINVQSSFGYGTLFVVNIHQKISLLNKPKDEVIVKNKDKDLKILKNKKVLIVDDNVLNIKVARRAIEQLNMEIDDCTSGEKCLKLVKKNKYDVILMDIMMPDMSGEETLKELKKDKSFDIPVIALTADAISGSKKRYESQGFNSYVAKPFNKEQIKVELEKVLRKE